MYYILKISNKAFVKLEDNGDTTIVSDPNKASQIGTPGDAMREAAKINEDWDANVVQILRVG